MAVVVLILAIILFIGYLISIAWGCLIIGFILSLISLCAFSLKYYEMGKFPSMFPEEQMEYLKYKTKIKITISAICSIVFLVVMALLWAAIYIN